MAPPSTGGLNEVSDIPKAWRHALAAVQVTFPDAVIAGGALRDRDHGVKVKDIDIFISTTPLGYGSGDIVSRLQRDGWADVQLNGDESYGNDALASKRGLVAVIDLKYPECPPIQLIAMKQFRLEEIDFGICQIMFDGKRIVRLPDYHHDAAAHQFRVIPKVDDAMYVRSLGRWARLKEKYPEWKLHLGSRAEEPFKAPKTIWPPKPDFAKGGVLRGSFDFGAPMTAPLDYLLRTRSEEFVVPKALAERMSRELTKTTVRPHRNAIDKFEINVHPDDIPAAAKMIQETVDRINDQHRMAAIRGTSVLGRP